VTVREAVGRSGLAAIDAQVLLAHVLGVDRVWLVAHADDELPPGRCEAFASLVARRREGEPVAYLTGVREFWGLPLVVDPVVLIPRPETEILVDCALAALPRAPRARVLDLGTGSGAIACAIARERPQAEVVATDVSPAALAIAGTNVARLKLANVRLLQSDWYGELPGDAERFDLIASNPPYVAEGDPHLRSGDLRYEPPSALRAGPDGLDALRVVVHGAPARLETGGMLAVEHGFDQGEAVRALMLECGLADVATLNDLAGLERVTHARRRSPVSR
jgi:release factor glutamine methyltransferase